MYDFGKALWILKEFVFSVSHQATLYSKKLETVVTHTLEDNFKTYLVEFIDVAFWDEPCVYGARSRSDCSHQPIRNHFTGCGTGWYLNSSSRKTSFWLGCFTLLSSWGSSNLFPKQGPRYAWVSNYGWTVSEKWVKMVHKSIENWSVLLLFCLNSYWLWYFKPLPSWGYSNLLPKKAFDMI